MRCFGRVKHLKRCGIKNKNIKFFFPFCRHHRFQPAVFLLLVLPALYSEWTGMGFLPGLKSYARAIFNKDDRSSLDLPNNFSNRETSFKLLILPFDPLEDCVSKNAQYEKALIKRMREIIIKDSLDFEIVFKTDQPCVSSYNEGKVIGKKFNADLVIWGDIYEKCSPDSSKACLKYSFVDDQYLTNLKKGTTGIRSISGVEDISQGYLQRDIEFITFFLLALEEPKMIHRYPPNSNRRREEYKRIIKYLEKTMEYFNSYSPAYQILILEQISSLSYTELSFDFPAPQPFNGNDLRVEKTLGALYRIIELEPDHFAANYLAGMIYYRVEEPILPNKTHLDNLITSKRCLEKCIKIYPMQMMKDNLQGVNYKIKELSDENLKRIEIKQ